MRQAKVVILMIGVTFEVNSEESEGTVLWGRVTGGEHIGTYCYATRTALN